MDAERSCKLVHDLIDELAPTSTDAALLHQRFIALRNSAGLSASEGIAKFMRVLQDGLIFNRWPSRERARDTDADCSPSDGPSVVEDDGA